MVHTFMPLTLMVRRDTVFYPNATAQQMHAIHHHIATSGESFDDVPHEKRQIGKSSSSYIAGSYWTVLTVTIHTRSLYCCIPHLQQRYRNWVIVFNSTKHLAM